MTPEVACPGPRSVRTLRQDVFSLLNDVLPRTRAIDNVIHLARFVRAHRRMPRKPHRSDSTFNDFIFFRLAQSDWSYLERFCVDKEYVKLFVGGACPEVRIAPPIDILRLSSSVPLQSVESVLLARRGENVVAKPTHSSGTVLFLRKKPPVEEVRRFCAAASRSYYDVSRESLYAGLERKILLEEDLSAEDREPIDYKFFCARGAVLFCQIDIDRFSGHRRRLVTESFRPINVRYMHDMSDDVPAKPAGFERMVGVARRLSTFFRFVRVDLYCVHETVFFGELTFAPEGGAGSLSDEAFGVSVMASIRSANSKGLRLVEPFEDALVAGRQATNCFKRG